LLVVFDCDLDQWLISGVELFEAESMFFEQVFDIFDRGGLVDFGDIDGGVQVGGVVFGLLLCIGIGGLFSIIGGCRFFCTGRLLAFFVVIVAASGDIYDQAASSSSLYTKVSVMVPSFSRTDTRAAGNSPVSLDRCLR
jgi:hypothetical protein